MWRAAGLLALLIACEPPVLHEVVVDTEGAKSMIVAVEVLDGPRLRDFLAFDVDDENPAAVLVNTFPVVDNIAVYALKYERSFAELGSSTATIAKASPEHTGDQLPTPTTVQRTTVLDGRVETSKKKSGLPGSLRDLRLPAVPPPPPPPSCRTLTTEAVHDLGRPTAAEFAVATSSASALVGWHPRYYQVSVTPDEAVQIEPVQVEGSTVTEATLSDEGELWVARFPAPDLGLGVGTLHRSAGRLVFGWQPRHLEGAWWDVHRLAVRTVDGEPEALGVTVGGEILHWTPSGFRRMPPLPPRGHATVGDVTWTSTGDGLVVWGAAEHVYRLDQGTVVPEHVYGNYGLTGIADLPGIGTFAASGIGLILKRRGSEWVAEGDESVGLELEWLLPAGDRLIAAGTVAGAPQWLKVFEFIPGQGYCLPVTPVPHSAEGMALVANEWLIIAGDHADLETASMTVLRFNP